MSAVEKMTFRRSYQVPQRLAATEQRYATSSARIGEYRMAYDHSKTYRDFKLRNLPHRWRIMSAGRSVFSETQRISTLAAVTDT